MKKAAEALFEIHRQLLEREARGEQSVMRQWRFFPYPCADGRLVLACAELADGTDIEVLFALDAPIDPDDFDESVFEEAFLAMPSTSRH